LRTSLTGTVQTNVKNVNYLEHTVCAMSDRCCYRLVFVTDSVTFFCILSLSVFPQKFENSALVAVTWFRCFQTDAYAGAGTVYYNCV